MAKKFTNLRLERLELTNFKAIDHLVLEFPPPLMAHDPDIIVMGSSNGVGKTSVLEACMLLFLGVNMGPHGFGKIMESPVNMADMFIRSGEEAASINGVFSVNNNKFEVNFYLSRASGISIGGDFSDINKNIPDIYERGSYEKAEKLLMLFTGVHQEPIVLSPGIYFHSFRKVHAGNLTLGMLLGADDSRSHMRGGFHPNVSLFKWCFLQAMMSRGGLFETLDDNSAQDALDLLNRLVEQYAEGSIGKLRPDKDDTIDFRIHSKKNGESFSFNSLSSGQKEIIATLFLIWHYTRNEPRIVLIDEPELHLNARWHQDFVEQLYKLAPNNQYIMASHSVDIFSSVDADRRIFIRNY